MQFLLPIILSVGSVVGLVLLVSLLARNYIKVPPNQMAVFFGRRHGEKGYRVVTGGARWKWPIIEDVLFMDLATFQLKVGLKGIPNKDGVKINVDAVATCKIKADESSLGAAVERFLGKRNEEIHTVVSENLEGQLRSVIGTMTIEELIKERELLIQKVKSEAASELDKIGVGIDILNIQNISDDKGYIEALGAKRVAEVKRDATIGTADAERAAKQQATTFEKDGAIKAAENQALTAEAEKERDVKRATYMAEVASEKAKADQAGPLANAKAMQGVVVEQVKVDEERAKAQIGVQEQMIAVASKQKEAEIVVPAKKNAEALVAQAEGAKKKAVVESEGTQQSQINVAMGASKKMELEGAGEASKTKAVGEAQAAAMKAKMLAEAEGTKAKLLAEAEGRRAMMLAEAEGAKAKNEALKEMSIGSILQMTLDKIPGLLEKMPEIVDAATKHLEAIDKVVIIDNGGDGKSGIQKFASQGPAALLTLAQTAKEMGFDISGTLSKLGVKMEDVVEMLSNVDSKKPLPAADTVAPKK